MKVLITADSFKKSSLALSVLPSMLAIFYPQRRLVGLFFKVRFVISHRLANSRRVNHEHTQSLSCTGGFKIKFISGKFYLDFWCSLFRTKS